MEYYGTQANNLPAERRETLIDKLERCEQAGVLRLKGYSWRDIAELMDISVAQAKSLADEYKSIIRQQAEDDPYFMDRLQENTLTFLREFEELSKEAWETVQIATDAGMVGARVNALKVAGEFASQRARLLQLLGGKVDSGYIARMQKAETVNQVLSGIIRDLIAECDHCRDEGLSRLSEAFALMGDDSSAANQRDFDYDLDEDDDDGGDDDDDEIVRP